ncbi:methyltransferase domain-containing protein, partial [Cardiosporidium cionae]
YKPWPNVVKFLSQFPKGSLVLDCGCGNGKYLNCLPSTLQFIGFDRSYPLLRLSKEKGATEVLQADCETLVFRDGIMDGCISVAVIHHLITVESRAAAIKEMVRCTKIHGEILVSVWAFEQEKGTIGARQFDSQDVLVPWKLQKSHCAALDEKDTNFSSDVNAKLEDTSLPTQQPVCAAAESSDLIMLKRYYHVFKRDELYNLCASIKNIQVVDLYLHANNWIIILKKIEATAKKA